MSSLARTVLPQEKLPSLNKPNRPNPVKAKIGNIVKVLVEQQDEPEDSDEELITEDEAIKLIVPEEEIDLKSSGIFIN